MRYIKLFEQNKSLVTIEHVHKFVDEYVSDIYLALFDDAIENKEIQLGKKLPSETLADIIALMYDENILVDYSDSAAANGTGDLYSSIVGSLNIMEIIEVRIREILKTEAENDIDNYLRHKDLYKKLKVNVPEIKRADDSGLLDMK